MKVIDRIKGMFVRNLTIREPDGWVHPSAVAETGELVTDQAAMSLSAVWACVNLIAGTIASLPLVVYRVNSDGQRVVADDHPLHRMLHSSPNYDQTAVDFWEYMAASLELWGNAYALKERTRGQVTGLTPISPILMSVRRVRSTGNIEYTWADEGEQHVKTDKDVLHIRGFGGNPLGGMSTLQFARNAFGLARASERSSAKLFANGMRPSGVLIFDQFLSKENRQVAKTELVTQFTGVDHAGRPLILEGGTKWESLNINPEDAQMIESRGFSVEEICRFFGVPPFMVGHTVKSTSWGTGLEQQTLGFQKFTLRRRLKRIEQAIGKQILTPAERSAGMSAEFNIEGLLRGDSESRAQFYQTMTQIGAMTINEVRRLENLPPIEGGDIPRMQMQNVPIQEAGS